MPSTERVGAGDAARPDLATRQFGLYNAPAGESFGALIYYGVPGQGCRMYGVGPSAQKAAWEGALAAGCVAIVCGCVALGWLLVSVRWSYGGMDRLPAMLFGGAVVAGAATFVISWRYRELLRRYAVPLPDAP